MLTYTLCFGCAMLFLLIFYIWGKTFLSYLGMSESFCDSILFGFIVLIITYQLFYLPVFLLRGSYRMATVSWLVVIGTLTIFLAVRLKQHGKFHLPSLTWKQWLAVGLIVSFSVFLCFFVSARIPIYGPDFNAYLTMMNELYYRDRINLSSGILDVHHGLNSFFGFMTIPSLLFGIRPYYIAVFMIRSLLIILSSLVTYRIGRTAFRQEDQAVCMPALWMMILVPVFLLLWDSIYQAWFYFFRSNEAKAYCQFVLLSLAFSVWLQMFQPDIEQKQLWILQFVVGLAAVPISMSSLTSYPLLAFVGMAALIAFDRFRNWPKTCLWSLLCATPNLLYAVLYFMVKRGFLVL